MALSMLQVAFLCCIFVAVCALCVGAYTLLRKSTLSQRVEAVTNAKLLRQGADESKGAWVETFVKLTKPIASLSVPTEGWETSALRRKFIQAGLRSESAPIVYFVLKSILAFGLPILVLIGRYLFGWKIDADELVMLLFVVMLLGFYLPNSFLDRALAARKLELFEAFPDALDLLTISVEAGLGMEQAIGRVSKEIRLNSASLADELELYGLEVRAGASRQGALRNLAARTGVDDIECLVAMLVQSERFGTSIGDALRVYSGSLRTKRHQRAEVAAAKVAVKLVFPLVLCIFPSILIVVAGPAMIQIGKVFGQVFGQ